MAALRKTYELWVQTYPRDDIPVGNLGINYLTSGDYNKALAATQEMMKLSPGSGLSYSNLVSSYVQVNRLDEARATAQEAQAHNLDSPLIQFNLYNIDFLQHDAVGMEREAASLMGKPGFEDLMLASESELPRMAGSLPKRGI